MAIGWLTVFKAIPWADVVAAAPAVAKGARRLVDAVRKRGSEGEAAGEAAAEDAGDPVGRLKHLEARVGQLEAGQQEALDLVESLAGQQEKLVAAVEVLRLRSRLLMWLCGALLLAIVVMSARLLA